MEKKIEGVCRSALKTFGEEHQQRKAVEEMGELNAALMQYKDGRVTKEAVITEVADVLITVSQLGLIFGLDEVSREVERKIDRLANTTAKRIIEDCEREHQGVIIDRNFVLKMLVKEMKEYSLSNTDAVILNIKWPDVQTKINEIEETLKREYYGG